jgi:flagellar motility protein MotE (MotC chaperone)
MNLTMTAILVLLLSFNTLAEELPLELQAPETAPVKKMSVPSETLMKLMEERQQDLDRREAAVRREEERLKLLRSDIEGLLKKQAGPVKSAAVSPSAGKPTGVPTRAANLVHLSQAFETMPVEEAAQRIEKMREAVALDLLARLKSKTAGQILAALDPAKAARLVEKLAADPGVSSSEVSLKRK